MSRCGCTGEDKCTYWCPVCLKHHVVPSLVTSCVEKDRRAQRRVRLTG